VREQRDGDVVARTLESLVEAAGDPGHNLMPLLVEAARANITEGEIVTALQTVFGSYREAPVF
jgi:methylmalonyl-CoA mutase N-terminal domain/subunit